MKINISTECEKCGHWRVCKQSDAPKRIQGELVDLVTSNKQLENEDVIIDIGCPHYMCKIREKNEVSYR